MLDPIWRRKMQKNTWLAISFSMADQKRKSYSIGITFGTRGFWGLWVRIRAQHLETQKFRIFRICQGIQNQRIIVHFINSFIYSFNSFDHISYSWKKDVITDNNDEIKISREKRKIIAKKWRPEEELIFFFIYKKNLICKKIMKEIYVNL